MKCMAKDLQAYIIVDENSFIVMEKATDKIIVRGLNIGGLYRLHECHTTTTLVGVRIDATIWYWRLGHLSQVILKKILTYVPVLGFNQFGPCEGCASNKGRHIPFSPQTFTTTRPLAIVHLDLLGSGAG